MPGGSSSGGRVYVDPSYLGRFRPFVVEVSMRQGACYLQHDKGDVSMLPLLL
jgi:hypothetical protein